MSKINAVRFINLNYNYNMFRISDETLYFNGESTLVKMDNGGGKSVLIQMLTAPFVQRRYRNVKDRPFASYFTSPKPTFILVEWQLEQGAGYVLTGMMVRQNQRMEEDRDEELEIVNFISEYREPCVQDIHHLPVVEKTKEEIRLKSFAECRALFDGYRREKGVRFISYDMGNSAQSKQYFDKLLEYGINYKEWQNIIRKINEQESGLSRLFDDCRDERGLVEKWFLETIENKLNRDQDRMQEFRNILEKYIASYRSTQDKIRRRDSILHFEEEAEKIRANAAEYLEGTRTCERRENEIASYLCELRRLSETASANLETEQACLEELQLELRRNDHQMHSADYYAAREQMEELQGQIRELQGILAEAEKDRNDRERTFHLYEMADRQEQTDLVRADLLEASQALEICRRKGEDLKPERDYIGYLLRTGYEQERDQVQHSFEETERALRTVTRRRKELGDAITGAERELRSHEQERGRLTASVQAYDETETRYVANWNEDLNRNLMGEYEPGRLALMAKNLEKERQDLAGARQAGRAQQEKLESSVRQMEDGLADLERQRQAEAEKLRAAKEKLQNFEDELNVRRGILQYLELKEDALFDTERIIRELDGRIAELELGTDRAVIESQELEKEILRLSTGRTVELSPELKEAMEGLGIHVVYGMEWLKRNGNTEQENLDLVERNPFLPYALLMTERELERLRAAALPVYTSAPIPVVVRESLADLQRVYTEDALPGTGVHFYMLFNRNLLNEERLQALLEQKQRELERKNEEIEHRRTEHREYLERRTRINAQKVTRRDYEETRAGIDELETQLAALQADIHRTMDELAAAREALRALAKELAELERRMERKERQSRELEGLAQAYERYLLAMQALHACEEKLLALDRKKKKLQVELQKNEEEGRILETRQNELRFQAGEIQRELSAYEWYEKTDAPAQFNPALEGDVPALIARYRAITETVSREEQELEEARKKANERLEKAEKELNRRAQKYGFQPADWQGVRYSPAQQDQAEAEMKAFARKIQELSADVHALEIRHGKKEEALRQILEWMMRDCGTREPLMRDEVPVIDYAERKNLLVHQRKEHEAAANDLAGRIRVYSANLTTLSEFQEIPVTEPVRFEEDFSGFTEEALRSFTGSLQRAYREAAENARDRRRRTEKVLQQVIRIEEFQEEYYQKPLETILALTEDAGQVLRQLDMVLQSYRDLMAKLMVDIAVVEKERTHVIAVLKEYTHEIHVQMGRIDRNSTVQVRGKPLKMLKITLPDWEENVRVFEPRIADMVDELTKKGIALLEKGEAIHDFVGKRMTTRELYDTVIGIGNVRIQLYKIEAQRELQITWSEVAKNSGGEGFLSAFVILSSLLYYMRWEETDIFADRNEGKVLLMDNPFAQTNAAHLLIPLMEVAKKNNTQLICFTGLSGESIYSRFDNIYVLNLIRSSLSNTQYLRGKHVAGSEPEMVSTARIEVSSDSGQLRMLF